MEVAKLRGRFSDIGNWSLMLALGVTLIVGGALGRSTIVGAQQTQPQDATFFPATGYRIASPAILDYFQRRGGVRTFGYPISNDFPLLGKRVQSFQRQMLEVRPDGSAAPANILGADMLPITRIDGLTLPPVDRELIANAPTPGTPDYLPLALDFVRTTVPDDWNGLPVNFLTAYLESVTCADAFGEESCDPSQLAAFALELWGLPTSLPTADPLNDDFVYQRFERGIMHFSRATGLSQGLLIGDWLKRTIVGINLAQDVGAEIRNSRLYGQYSPTRPLGLSRPDDLPDTSLAQAFRADTLAAAAQEQPTLPPSVAQTATSVAMTATAITATQAALTGTQLMLTATSIAATSTAAAASAAPPTARIVPASVVSDIPVDTSGCMGDEQMWFVPRKPFVGTHVEISVTSRRHHDVKFLRITGPLDPGVATERFGPLGFVWTWTVAPTIEAFHQWTFYADGLRPCITSGFNAFAPLGATATPTETPIPTATPGTATATPTQTPVPAPSITDIIPSTDLTCGQLVTVRGHNFGSPPSSFGTFVQLQNGSTFTTLQQVGTGSNTQLRVQMPSNLTASPSTITVSNNGGDSESRAVGIRSPNPCP